GAAALNRFAYEQEGGEETPAMASKARGMRLKRGQAVRLETPGGGGYGPAAERAPEAVARDVASGLLTEAAADAAYGDAWRSA
ncbi:MAG: hydantoinase B/oxoprolinase family protein, partial [Pseudomonadota bacterium]